MAEVVAAVTEEEDVVEDEAAVGDADNEMTLRAWMDLRHDGGHLVATWLCKRMTGFAELASAGLIVCSIPVRRL